MNWRLELICIVVLSYQRKNCFAWLHKYSQTETRIFYLWAVLYVINNGGPGTVNRCSEKKKKKKEELQEIVSSHGLLVLNKSEKHKNYKALKKSLPPPPPPKHVPQSAKKRKNQQKQKEIKKAKRAKKEALGLWTPYPPAKKTSS